MISLDAFKNKKIRDLIDRLITMEGALILFIASVVLLRMPTLIKFLNLEKYIVVIGSICAISVIIFVILLTGFFITKNKRRKFLKTQITIEEKAILVKLMEVNYYFFPVEEVSNLISNAIVKSCEGGKVRIVSCFRDEIGGYIKKFTYKEKHNTSAIKNRKYCGQESNKQGDKKLNELKDKLGKLESKYSEGGIGDNFWKMNNETGVIEQKGCGIIDTERYQSAVIHYPTIFVKKVYNIKAQGFGKNGKEVKLLIIRKELSSFTIKVDEEFVSSDIYPVEFFFEVSGK